MKHVVMAVILLSGCGADDSQKTKRIVCLDGSELFLTEIIEEQISPSNKTLCQNIIGEKPH